MCLSFDEQAPEDFVGERRLESERVITAQKPRFETVCKQDVGRPAAGFETAGGHRHLEQAAPLEEKLGVAGRQELFI